ncbi:uncharacterized protein [Argopecten irradians]
MDTLIDSLLTDQWEEVSAGDRGDGFIDYFINGNPTQVDANTLRVVISDEDGNAKNVNLNGTQANKNPFKGIGRIELKVDDDCNLVGIDLNGDVVLRKS